VIINIIGKCDHRPVDYTLIKLLQVYGDVIYMTDNTKALSMSDTKERGGYFQNVCISTFDKSQQFEPLKYEHSYEYIIISGVIVQPSDISIHCTQTTPDKQEKTMFKNDISEYKYLIELYSDKNKYFGPDLAATLKEFEKGVNMVPISAGLTNDLATWLSEPLKVRPEYIYETIMGKAPRKKFPIPIKLPKFIKR